MKFVVAIVLVTIELMRTLFTLISSIISSYDEKAACQKILEKAGLEGFQVMQQFFFWQLELFNDYTLYVVIAVVKHQ